MAKGTDAADILDDFCQHHTVVNYCGDYYLFDGRRYRVRTESAIENLILTHIRQNFLRDDFAPDKIRQVRKLLGMSAYIEGMWQPFWLDDPEEVASVLVTTDGIVDCEPMYDGGDPVLLPHTPDLFATAESKIHWDPNATCDKFDEFLRWFTYQNSAVEQLLLEFIASIILRRIDHQQFLILHGSGSNGKSVLLHAIRRLMGAANCSALGFERFGGRFDLSGLGNKAANIAADTNEVTKVAEGILKQLVDHSELSFERKYRETYGTTNHARLIFATNISPRWRDRTDGLWRRLLLVPCQAIVAGDGIIRKMENQFNYAGVLNRVLAAGHLLIDRKGFAIPSLVLDAVAQERMDSNPHRQFLVDRTCPDPDAFLMTEQVYACYTEWCGERGYMPLAMNNFGKEIRAHYHAEILNGTVKPGKSHDKPRRNGYHGLAFCRSGVEEYLESKERKQQRAEQRAAGQQKQAAEVEKIEQRLSKKPKSKPKVDEDELDELVAALTEESADD